MNFGTIKLQTKIGSFMELCALGGHLDITSKYYKEKEFTNPSYEKRVLTLSSGEKRAFFVYKSLTDEQAIQEHKIAECI